MAKRLSSKTSSEIVPLTWDFSNIIPGPNPITLPVTPVTIQVNYGTDPAVSSMLQGPASIGGYKVTQLIKNGVNDVEYLVICRVLYNSEEYELASILPVVDNLPG